MPTLCLLFWPLFQKELLFCAHKVGWWGICFNMWLVILFKKIYIKLPNFPISKFLSTSWDVWLATRFPRQSSLSRMMAHDGNQVQNLSCLRVARYIQESLIPKGALAHGPQRSVEIKLLQMPAGASLHTGRLPAPRAWMSRGWGKTGDAQCWRKKLILSLSLRNP